ncbi:MAG: CaiB/BaiF CoA transferase family protein [Acidimicrobiia bacterium]
MADARSHARTSGPLSGFRVLDLSRFFAGGYATLALVDLGADVVKVEPPKGGDPIRNMAPAHIGLNRGKRSITLDTRHPDAVAVLKRLVRYFDVVVENNTPGTMEAMGFGFAEATVENPGVVWCSVTGFGQDGPYVGRPGHDITYLGHSGFLRAMAEHLPFHPQTTIAVPVGALMGAMGVAAALAQRSVTGKGSRVDASLTDAATWLLSGDFITLSGMQRGGLGKTASRQFYTCSDGRMITIAASEPRTWKAFCDAAGKPEWIDKLMAREEQEWLTGELSALFATKPAAEWVATLGGANGCVGPVNDGPDLVDDPHAKARSMWIEVDGMHVPGNPVRLSDATGTVTSQLSFAGPSALGADTDEIYAAAGFSDDELAALRASGAV